MLMRYSSSVKRLASITLLWTTENVQQVAKVLHTKPMMIQTDRMYTSSYLIHIFRMEFFNPGSHFTSASLSLIITIMISSTMSVVMCWDGPESTDSQRSAVSIMALKERIKLFNFCMKYFFCIRVVFLIVHIKFTESFTLFLYFIIW